MIIWINGPFGAGKTSLAKALASRLPDAITFDPELVGTILSRTVPPTPSQDFQDLPIWREAVVSHVLLLRKHYENVLIIPMTLVRPEYIQQILPPIEAQGEPLLHLFLQIERTKLEERITGQIICPDDPVRDERIRSWRLAQVSRCIASEIHMPAGTVFLESTKAPEQLAAEVLEILASHRGPLS